MWWEGQVWPVSPTSSSGKYLSLSHAGFTITQGMVRWLGMGSGWDDSNVKSFLGDANLSYHHICIQYDGRNFSTCFRCTIWWTKDCVTNSRNAYQDSLAYSRDCQENRLFTLIFLFIFYAHREFTPMNSYPSPFMTLTYSYAPSFLSRSHRVQDKRDANQL